MASFTLDEYEEPRAQLRLSVYSRGYALKVRTESENYTRIFKNRADARTEFLRKLKEIEG